VTYRIRAMDADYDMRFGLGGNNFLVDNSAAVAQRILTRLELWMTEWYLDLSDGTPWLQQILGKPVAPGSPDAAIRERITGTPYVTRLIDYASSWNPTTRGFTVGAKVDTRFGTTSFVVNLVAPMFAGSPGQPGQQRLLPPPGR
jgi:hypothetical protein